MNPPCYSVSVVGQFTNYLTHLYYDFRIISLDDFISCVELRRNYVHHLWSASYSGHCCRYYRRDILQGLKNAAYHSVGWRLLFINPIKYMIMDYFFIDVYDDGYSINIEVCYPWDSKDEVVKYEHTLPLETVCGQVVISKRMETNTSLNGGQLPIVKLPVDKCIIEYHY